MLQRRTTKLAVLLAAFLGMMVGLVPMLIEEADARTGVTITSTAGNFYNRDVHLVRGNFWSGPSYSPPGDPIVVRWTSWEGKPWSPIGWGWEHGRFTANINLPGIGPFPDPRVSLEYQNPSPGGGPNS